MHALHGREALKHGHAMEMVDLMLKAYAHQVAGGLVAHKVAIKVVRLYNNMIWALDLAVVTGNRQSALVIGHQIVGLFDDNGVDEDVGVVI